MGNRIIAYINFFLHWSFILFAMWLSGIGIEYYTDYPAPSFGIHTGVIVFVIIFLVRQYLPGGNINFIPVKHNKKEPEISDINPLD